MECQKEPQGLTDDTAFTASAAADRLPAAREARSRCRRARRQRTSSGDRYAVTTAGHLSRKLLEPVY